MHVQSISWFGRQMKVGCDGNCGKAWGLSARPRIRLDFLDPEDIAFLADSELDQAPADPGAFSGYRKPAEGPAGINKWCALECERSTICGLGHQPEISDFSERRYTQPWKHGVPPDQAKNDSPQKYGF
ncbi:TPA: hypothetical protein QDB04_002234 [Burkholderia vietnamiensis]|nr:hypothetical protein [Burkholderia vietnamiensis]